MIFMSVLFWGQTSDIASHLVQCPKFDIRRFWNFGSKFRKLESPIFSDLEWPECTRIFGFWGQTSDIGLRLVSCPKFDIHRFWDFGSKVRKFHGNARGSPKMSKIRYS